VRDAPRDVGLAARRWRNRSAESFEWATSLRTSALLGTVESRLRMLSLRGSKQCHTQGYARHEQGHARPSHSRATPVHDTERSQGNAIPMIVRADGTNNGAWFQYRHMYLQNEDTGKQLPNHIDFRSYAQLLVSDIEPPARSPQSSLRSRGAAERAAAGCQPGPGAGTAQAGG